MASNAIPLLVNWPDGWDRVHADKIVGSESLSTPYQYEVELTTDATRVDMLSVLNTGMGVGITLASGSERWAHGNVARVQQVGWGPEAPRYRVFLQPSVSFLELEVNCRIFQEMTTRDIIEQLLGDAKVESSWSASGTGITREYCVQYMESTLNFITRLMEDEGWSYFFKHTKSGHTLVITDGSSEPPACPGLTTVSVAVSLNDASLEDVLTEYAVEHRVATQQVKVGGFNPASDSPTSTSHGTGTPTSWEYEWEAKTNEDTDRMASRKVDGFTAEEKRLTGKGACRGMVMGHMISIREALPSGFPSNWLIRTLNWVASRDSYHCDFEATSGDTPYRPSLAAKRPAVVGTQTALVTGKSGEDVWTDDQGRVKVRFPWDLASTDPESSTCWIPVVQSLAGAGWGTRYIPRPGQQVVVTFVGGNPNNPIVTGSIHGPTRLPPAFDEPRRYGMRSIEGGDDSLPSEFSILDDPGSEEVFVQAQKDYKLNVVGDSTTTVAGTQSETITGTDTKTVTDGDEVVQVQTGKRTVTVADDHALESQASFKHDVAKDMTLSVTKDLTIKVQGDVKFDVTGKFSLQAAEITIKGGPITIDSNAALDLKSGEALTAAAGTALTNKAGTSLTNQAGTSLTNQSGTSLTNQAGTNLTNNAELVLENTGGASQKVSASGPLQLQGAMVQLN
jgi:type VI secretion system secreted protein VgrG